ncbi:hypothetical protein JMJ77_0005321, partial [Colletotrichum scovillei]
FVLLAIKAEFSRFPSKKHFPANIQSLSHTLRVFTTRSAIHGPCLELGHDHLLPTVAQISRHLAHGGEVYLGKRARHSTADCFDPLDE